MRSPAPLKRVPILKQRARGPLAWAGTRCREQAGGGVRQQRSAGKRQRSTDTVAASLAAGPTISSAFEQPTLPSPTRKTGSTVKKEAENPIYVLSAFCGGSGIWIPCPYCHAFIPCSPCPGYCPESRSFSPPFMVPTTARLTPERPATAARCAVPGPVPLTGRLRRTCGASGPDRGKPANCQPRRPSARGTLGRRARPGPLSATTISLTSRAESALDIAGLGWQASPRYSPARTGTGARGETSTTPTATAREPRPLARVTPKRRTRVGRRLP